MSFVFSIPVILEVEGLSSITLSRVSYGTLHRMAHNECFSMSGVNHLDHLKKMQHGPLYEASSLLVS